MPILSRATTSGRSVCIVCFPLFVFFGDSLIPIRSSPLKHIYHLRNQKTYGADHACKSLDVSTKGKEHECADKRRSRDKGKYDGREFEHPVFRLAILCVDVHKLFLVIDFRMKRILGHANNSVCGTGKHLLISSEFLAGRQRT